MFNGNYVLTGIIMCKSGLHIGGSNNNIEIGGSDNVVIRDATNNLPYIPGSSLKGKLRSLLELNDEDIFMNVTQNDGKPSDKGIVADVFGKASDKSDYNINTSNISPDTEDKLMEIINDLQRQIDELKNNEKSCDNNDTSSQSTVNASITDEDDDTTSKAFTKIIVRDSYPTRKTIKKWNANYEILNGTELKYENTIDRIKCTSNPRNIERVPKDSEFKFEIIYGIYNDNENGDYARKVFNLINKGFKLLESNYLGGSGTRGFGRVEIKDKKLVKRSRDYYENNADEETILDETTKAESQKNGGE